MPTKYQYKPYEAEKLNDLSNVIHDPSELSELTKQLEANIESNIDMEEFIKAKYLFSDEKIADCLKTNTVQMTMREQVQAL